MNKFIHFFNFRFVLSLALISLLVLVFLNSEEANQRAKEESKRADIVTVYLNNQQKIASAERKQLSISQTDLFNRYTSLEKAQNALLDWLNDSGIEVPIKITKLFVYKPAKKVVSPRANSSKITKPGKKSTKPVKPPKAKGLSKSLNNPAKRR